MSDFAKSALKKTIRTAVAAYLDLCALEASHETATEESVNEAVQKGANELRPLVDCPTECQLAYQTCISKPGANRALCARTRDICLADC